ncbi:MAG: hypothetical protein JWN56_1567 [Sphingobacteriales bacterium]|nr:hypothetical protein [Sphingobacteriales bacterium]
MQKLLIYLVILCVKNYYYTPSGYGVFILPPWPVSMRVNTLREDCCKTFGLKKALRPPVHITLGKLFEYNSEFESQLIKNLRAHTRSIIPFEQQLEDFGSFKSHTVYVKAVQNQSIGELNYASSFISGGKRQYNYKGKLSSFKPHLSIAYRDLTEELYPLVWEEYKDQKFEASFTVTKFTLVKWDAVNFSWKNIHDFPLEGSKPLTLFS